MFKKIILFCVLMFAFVMQENVFAGVKVSGCCNSTGGQIATPGEVSNAAKSAAEKVSNVVLEVGQAMESGQDKTTGMINKSFEFQNAYLEDLFKGLGLAQEKMKNLEMYGEASRVYEASFDDCAGDDSGSRAYQGIKAEKQLSGLMKENLRDHSLKTMSSSSGYRRIVNQDMEDISSELIFPSDLTLSVEDVEKAKEMVKTMADPFPVPALTNSQKNTGSGEQTETLRKIREARMDVPKSVLMETVASYAPTLDMDEFATAAWERMGEDGEPDFVKDDMISPMAYINLMVDSRFANSTWLADENTGIHKKNYIGLLRELLVMNSVKMEMDRRQTKNLQQIAVMLATKTANETTKEMDEAMSLYRDEAISDEVLSE
ncbi:MAG: hypothetical protein ACOCYO_11105 [Bacteroidota bacterium]